MTYDPLDWLDERLAQLTRQHELRRPSLRAGKQGASIDLDGRTLINFGANDYLGLAADSRLAEAVASGLESGGWGSGASPLVSGRTASQAELERQLADFEQTEAALVFPSGFAANVGVLASLAGRGDAIFSDAKNHASLIDGCRLSRADVLVYRHTDLAHLEQQLDSVPAARRKLIVTDTLFSMDGDLAPLADLVEIAERYRAILVVDEAHATGVFGACGRGVSEFLNVEDSIPVRIGTLSKALGSIGGFVVGQQRLIDWVFNRARSQVFSTALPAACHEAAKAALQIVRDEPHRRHDVLERSAELRNRIIEQGWSVGSSCSQIIPIVVGDAEQAMTISHRLRDKGLFVPGIRPPTVPIGQSLLRISLSYAHSAEDQNQLLAALSG